MEYGIVYVVLNEGQVVYASIDKEDAEDFAYNKEENVVREALTDLGIDDPNEKQIYEANFQAGNDGGIYEVIDVDIAGKIENDVIESATYEITVSDILEKLKHSHTY